MLQQQNPHQAGSPLIAHSPAATACLEFSRKGSGESPATRPKPSMSTPSRLKNCRRQLQLPEAPLCLPVFYDTVDAILVTPPEGTRSTGKEGWSPKHDHLTEAMVEPTVFGGFLAIFLLKWNLDFLFSTPFVPRNSICPRSAGHNLCPPTLFMSEALNGTKFISQRSVDGRQPKLSLPPTGK